MSVFNHEEHGHLLEEARRELEILGKHKLAGAVGRALALHFDMVSRVANAERIKRKLTKLSAAVEEAANDLGEYVAKDELPWITKDKFR